MTSDDVIEFSDSTEDASGGRIPETTYFWTTWDKKTMTLLKYSRRWGRSSESKVVLPADFNAQDKAAVARHRRKVEEKLGLRALPEKVKILVYSPIGNTIYAHEAVEKKEVFIDGSQRISKSDSWTYWSEEKARLAKEYNERVEWTRKQFADSREVIFKKEVRTK
jgi:hypothetical protein